MSAIETEPPSIIAEIDSYLASPFSDSSEQINRADDIIWEAQAYIMRLEKFRRDYGAMNDHARRCETQINEQLKTILRSQEHIKTMAQRIEQLEQEVKDARVGHYQAQAIM